jgi:hypothetical protein
MGRRAIRRPFSLGPSKKVGISAIRRITAKLTAGNLADFSQSGAIPSLFRVKTLYFTFVKNEALKPAAEAFKNSVPRRESAPGAREKKDGGHANRIAGNRIFLSHGQGAS